MLDNTKKDLFWYMLAMLVVALHLGTAYFIALPKELGYLYGVGFVAVAGFMWYFHEKSDLGAYLLMIVAIVPIGHGRISFELTGLNAVKELLLIYGLFFGPAFIIWTWRKTVNYFSPKGEEEEVPK